MCPPLDQWRYHLRFHVWVQLLLLGDSPPYPVNSSQKKAQVLFLDDLLHVLPSFSTWGSCEVQSWTLPEPLGLSQWNVGRDDQWQAPLGGDPYFWELGWTSGQSRITYCWESTKHLFQLRITETQGIKMKTTKNRRIIFKCCCLLSSHHVSGVMAPPPPPPPAPLQPRSWALWSESMLRIL